MTASIDKNPAKVKEPVDILLCASHEIAIEVAQLHREDHKVVILHARHEKSVGALPVARKECFDPLVFRMRWIRYHSSHSVAILPLASR